MGKAYAEEIGMLSKTHDWAARAPIGSISEFVRRSAGLPLYVVGSGGSLSAAAFASQLHQQTGIMSKYLTPLELQELDAINGRCAMLLVSAGGNNVDILSAFDKATDLGPDLLGVLCASADNKLTHKASTCRDVLVHAAGLPTGRDGFLATNTLLATMAWLARAYAIASTFVDGLPESTNLLYDGVSEKMFARMITDRLRPLRDRDTVVILHDGWGKAAAIDAESKLTEAGLVGVQAADYRNFAHGRHNWLDKHRDRTGVIALVTPRCSRLATRTLHLIPEYAPAAVLSSNFDGPAASLNLLVKVMYMVKFFGEARGIDPGRPRVAQFGREIHHMTMPPTGSWLND